MIRIVKKFGKLLDTHQKGHIAIILIMMVVGAFLEVLSVSLLVPLISAMMQPNIIETNRYIGAFCGFFGITDSRELLIVCLCALVVIFILKNVYLILEYYVQYRFIYNNRFATQRRILGIYLRRPYEFFLSADSGEIVRVINTDVSNSYTLLMSLLSIATELIVSLVLILAVLVINPTITIATGAVLLVTMLVIARVVKPRLRKAGFQRQDSAAATNKWLLQSINGIKEIKISQTEAYFQENYDKNGRIFVEADKKNSVFQAIPRMLIEMTTTCVALIVIACMVLAGAEMNSLIPALSAFVMAAIKLLPSANRIVGGINQIAFQEPALDQLLEKINALEEGDLQAFKEPGSEPGLRNPQKEIRLSDILYSYPNAEKPVISHGDMVVPIGSSVGIIGASGAGKTTAVDILLGLLNVQSGQVLCDGVDVKTDYQAWLSHIGYIPQMIFMLDDTIRANVAFGRSNGEIDDAKIWEAVEKAQLGDFVRSLPEGLDTGIGERGIRVSGGQRQRIGIARALYTDPEILVFDEATSALDNETEAAIMESIHALHGEKTMIIIAHRLTTIEECDMVYRVENGKIILERKERAR